MPQLRIINGFERMSDAELLVKVHYILLKMTNNSNFISPTPSLASLTALANAFEQAIVVAGTGSHEGKVARDVRKQELVDTLHYLGNYVLSIAQGDKLIAESSGFTLADAAGTKPPVEKPLGLQLHDGPNAGQLLLKFKRVKSATGYMYQVTTDPDSNQWQTVYGTVRKNLFTRLESGKKYWVRVAALGIKGQMVYSDAISRIVQ